MLVVLGLATAGCLDASEPEAAPAAMAPAAEPVAAQSEALFQDGCSNPWFTNAFVSVLSGNALFALFDGSPNTIFRSACNRHDNCYHSGLAVYGKTFYQCNIDLLLDMRAICRHNWSRWWEFTQKSSCMAAAQQIYVGVAGFGSQYFHTPACSGSQTINTQDQADRNSSSGITCSTYEPYEGTPQAPSIRATELINDLEAVSPGHGADLYSSFYSTSAFKKSFTKWVNQGNKCEDNGLWPPPDTASQTSWCNFAYVEEPQNPHNNPMTGWGYASWYTYRTPDNTTYNCPYFIRYRSDEIWFDLTRYFFPGRVAAQLALMPAQVLPPVEYCERMRRGIFPPDPHSQYNGIYVHADLQSVWYMVWKDELQKLRTARAAAEAKRAHEAERLVFDPAVYLQIYPALGNAVGWSEALARQHWIDHGVAEGRAGSFVFDAAYYLERHPDVRNAYGAGNFKGAQEHWLAYGLREGRASSPVFDVGYYSGVLQGMEGGDAYGGAAYGGGGPGGGYIESAQHYLDTGMAACLRSSPSFDVRAYLRWNGDVNNACHGSCVCATQHYLTYGRFEGRRTVD